MRNKAAPVGQPVGTAGGKSAPPREFTMTDVIQSYMTQKGERRNTLWGRLTSLLPGSGSDGRDNGARASVKRRGSGGGGGAGEEEQRVVYVGPQCDEANGQFQYAGNKISTAKFTVLTFLPKNLFSQFRRVANFYFLLLMVLQLVPAISALNPLTTAIPLVVVLGITAAKDGFDDYKRHKSDRVVNGRPAYVLRGNEFTSIAWQDVVVGDIVRMTDHEFVAADVLLLATSEPDGLCYIETAELDGETNLKLRQALPVTASLNQKPDLAAFRGCVRCEAPNNNLATFVGALDTGGRCYAVENEAILLRGCVLRNTSRIYGVVLFAGHDTKLMQNSQGARFKRTSIDVLMNTLVLSICCFLVFLCVIAAICAFVWETNIGHDFQAYLPWSSPGDSPAAIGALQFLTSLILLNTLVPISLYVSVEVIRLGQSFLIDWDEKMYDEASDTPANARTTTLNEELGQIEYIFSDKTGTLTQNIMTFCKCSIRGVSYGEGVTEAMASVMKAQDPHANVAPREGSHRYTNPGNEFFSPDFEFVDGQPGGPLPSLGAALDKKDPAAVEFFVFLALCHTVLAKQEDGQLVFKAQSPDEAALVDAAKNFGCAFRGRTQNSLTVSVQGELRTYSLLNILDFNSTRKRMSIIVRCPDGSLKLLCKGADSIVFALLDAAGDPATAELVEVTSAHLGSFACEGLRTLVLAERVIPQAEYDAWAVRFEAASTALEGRAEKVMEVSEEIEVRLRLLGATAIEDKLQEGVPEAIHNLAAAGIKIWVLTGDKQETAVNIGYACRLLTDEQVIMAVSGRSGEAVQVQLEKFLAEWSPADQRPHALVIDGGALFFALHPDLKLTTIRLARRCQAVICCRVSPLQKALVVSLVKQEEEAVTLAIGDGANDVSMIQNAHIGVGISGQEGRQAVLASDYSLAQFRFLERLLLVHGRWSYVRMCRFLRYFFYKNFAFTMVQFWFATVNGFSGQTIYDQWFVASYNVIFTSLPVMATGIFEMDVDETMCLRFPEMYRAGQLNLMFNKRVFWMSLGLGIWKSVVIFVVPYLALRHAVEADGTSSSGLQFMGTTMASALVTIVNLQMALNTQYWTALTHVLIWGSIASWWFFMAVTNFLPLYGYYYVVVRVATSPNYWLTTLLTVLVAILPVLVSKFYMATYHPTPIDIVREIGMLERQRGGSGSGTGTANGAAKRQERSVSRTASGNTTQSSASSAASSNGGAIEQDIHVRSTSHSTRRTRPSMRSSRSNSVAPSASHEGEGAGGSYVGDETGETSSVQSGFGTGYAFSHAEGWGGVVGRLSVANLPGASAVSDGAGNVTRAPSRPQSTGTHKSSMAKVSESAAKSPTLGDAKRTADERKDEPAGADAVALQQQQQPVVPDNATAVAGVSVAAAEPPPAAAVASTAPDAAAAGALAADPGSKSTDDSIGHPNRIVD